MLDSQTWFDLGQRQGHIDCIEFLRGKVDAKVLLAAHEYLLNKPLKQIVKEKKYESA